MKKFIRYVNCILFSLLFTTGGAGACAYTATPVQSGIYISSDISSESADDAPTQEELESLQDNVYALLLAYADANTATKPTDKTKATLRSYAEQIGDVIADMGLSSQSFGNLIELCGEEQSVQAFADLTPSALSNFYASLASAVGFDNAGILSYRLVLLRYDILYEQKMARYETYGYSYLLTQAEDIAAEKALFIAEIGEKNFLLVAQEVCGICTQTSLSEGGGSLSLSDGEILTLLQAQKSTSLELSDEGWKLLLGYLKTLYEKEYWGKLLSATQKNGDDALFASRMNDAVKLIRNIQQRLTEEEVALLKAGDTEGLLAKIFTLFGEEDWKILEELANLPNTEDYDAVAKEYFGATYEEYARSVEKYSLDDVKANVGKDGFLKILEGFTAGVSTAVAYGIFR